MNVFESIMNGLNEATEDANNNKKELQRRVVTVVPVKYIGGNVYFKVEVSNHNSKLDVGWRYGYTRKVTKVYKKNLKTNKNVLLYSY